MWNDKYKQDGFFVPVEQLLGRKWKFKFCGKKGEPLRLPKWSVTNLTLRVIIFVNDELKSTKQLTAAERRWQWRIQDFPGAANLLSGQFSFKNCMKMKKFWTGGGRVPQWPPTQTKIIFDNQLLVGH